MRCRNVAMEARGGGVQVTLIDFTLSRLTLPSGAVAFCDLSADPALFQGPNNDCQVSTHLLITSSSIQEPHHEISKLSKLCAM